MLLCSVPCAQRKVILRERLGTAGGVMSSLSLAHLFNEKIIVLDEWLCLFAHSPVLKLRSEAHWGSNWAPNCLCGR